MSPRTLLRQIVTVLLLSFCLVNLFVLVILRRNQSDGNFLSLPTIFGQGYIDDLSDYEDLQLSTNELDGCYHVFLDVGSNIGNTVSHFFFLNIHAIFG